MLVAWDGPKRDHIVVMATLKSVAEIGEVRAKVRKTACMHCQRQGFPVGDFLWGTIATQVAGGVEWRVQGAPAEAGRYTLTLDGVGEKSVHAGSLTNDSGSALEEVGPRPFISNELPDG